MSAPFCPIEAQDRSHGRQTVEKKPQRNSPPRSGRRSLGRTGIFGMTGELPPQYRHPRSPHKPTSPAPKKPPAAVWHTSCRVSPSMSQLPNLLRFACLCATSFALCTAITPRTTHASLVVESWGLGTGIITSSDQEFDASFDVQNPFQSSQFAAIGRSTAFTAYDFSGPTPAAASVSTSPIRRRTRRALRSPAFLPETSVSSRPRTCCCAWMRRTPRTCRFPEWIPS